MALLGGQIGSFPVALAFSPILLLGAESIYSAYSMFKTGNVNQYFLLRQIHLVLLLSSPFILGCLFWIIHVASARYSQTTLVLVLAMAIFAISSGTFLWSTYANSSTTSQYFSTCPTYDLNKTLFVGRSPEEVQFSMVLWGPITTWRITTLH